MNELEIPTDVTALTPEWLTAALRGAGRIGQANVQTVDQQMLGEGQGFTAQVIRLRLHYDRDEAGAPRTVIAKLPAKAAHSAMQALDLYVREAQFYQEVAVHPGNPGPGVYYAALDAPRGRSILLLEDLAEGDVGDNVQGCTDSAAHLAVNAVGRFHAMWWEHPRLTSLTALAPRDPDGVAELCNQHWGACQSRLGTLLPERFVVIGNTAVRCANAYFRWATQAPQTLVHGDYRLDNLFFGRAEAGQTVIIFDWQLASRGRGVGDLAYFVAYSLPVAQRRAVERSLVTSYHRALGAGGVSGYSFDQCRHDYQVAMIGVLLRLIVTGGIVDFSSERGTRLAQVIIERVDAILADHDVASVLAAEFPSARS